jgi:hypothetical protein
LTDSFIERRRSSREPRSATIPSLANELVVLGAAGPRLEVRQLHLFPEPVDDVVDLELEHVLDAAVLVAAAATTRGVDGSWPRRNLVSGFAAP